MKKRPYVAVVVVTYNRCELLSTCLRAILGQSTSVDRIIVVDNASTDQTPCLFEPEGPFDRPDVMYDRLGENKGGAGGFKEGMRVARDLGCDWCWIMDDDVVPNPDALEQLLCACDYLAQCDIRPSFVASHVSGEHGEVMNVPNVSHHVSANGYRDWCEHLPQGLVRIVSATFVSLLISGDAMREIGLPISDYFLWGDDTEYTQRLTWFYGPAFVCGESTVKHLRVVANPISTAAEIDPKRIDNRRRATRNDLINVSYYFGAKAAARRIGHRLIECGRILVGPYALKARKVKSITGGIWDFLLRRYDLEDLKLLDKDQMRCF